MFTVALFVWPVPVLSTIVAEPELSEPAPLPLFITVALPPRPPPVAVAILALPVVEILPTLFASPVVIEGSVPELPFEVCPPLPTISAAGVPLGFGIGSPGDVGAGGDVGMGGAVGMSGGFVGMGGAVGRGGGVGMSEGGVGMGGAVGIGGGVGISWAKTTPNGPWNKITRTVSNIAKNVLSLNFFIINNNFSLLTLNF